MSDQELDVARAEEAMRRLKMQIGGLPDDTIYRRAAFLGAALAREGWTPPDPVESLVELLWQGWLNTPSEKADVKALIRECLNHGAKLDQDA